MNLIITCPRHFEEDAAEEITAMLKEFGYESIPDITITDMPGILTVIIPNENPIEIIEKIREKTREEPWSVRYLQRVIPIQMTLESEITQIVDGISKICSIMNHDQTYRITIEKRHSNLSSKEMITQIAKKIPNKVSLENCDWVVLVQILGNKAGVSVLEPNQIISIEKIKRSISE